LAVKQAQHVEQLRARLAQRACPGQCASAGEDDVFDQRHPSDDGPLPAEAAV